MKLSVQNKKHKKGTTMNKLLIAMLLLAGTTFADDDEFVDKTSGRSSMTEVKKAVTGSSSKTLAKVEKLRKCYKCFGKGTQVVSVREACERCEGTGYIEVEIELKDTVNAQYAWHSNYRTTRKVTTKKPCPQCNRRGKIPVKKEVDCPKCKGSGYLTKSGQPATLRGGQEDANAEEEESPTERGSAPVKSLAERLRANKTSVGAFEIDVPKGSGWGEVNYKANGGKFTIKGKNTEFVTLWMPVGDNAVRARKDLVEMVGCKSGQKWIPETNEELESFDWTHPSVIAHEGEIIAFMNRSGKFVAMKIVKINSAENLLHIEFNIY